MFFGFDVKVGLGGWSGFCLLRDINIITASSCICWLLKWTDASLALERELGLLIDYIALCIFHCPGIPIAQHNRLDEFVPNEQQQRNDEAGYTNHIVAAIA